MLWAEALDHEGHDVGGGRVGSGVGAICPDEREGWIVDASEGINGNWCAEAELGCVRINLCSGEIDVHY